MTSGVRRFTFSRAVVTLEIRFVLISSFHSEPFDSLRTAPAKNLAPVLCKNLSPRALPFQSWGLDVSRSLNMTRTGDGGNEPQPIIEGAVRSVFQTQRR